MMKLDVSDFMHATGSFVLSVYGHVFISAFLHTVVTVATMKCAQMAISIFQTLKKYLLYCFLLGTGLPVLCSTESATFRADMENIFFVFALFCMWTYCKK